MVARVLAVVRLARARDLTVDQLRPIHVQRWVDAQPGWKPGKRGAIVAVQRAFNWAAKMGLIGSSPVRYVEKPRAGRRDVVSGADEYSWILAHARDEEFLDLVAAWWETGCWPREVLSVKAPYVDRARSRWVLPPEESKGKRRHRVVYLSPAALAITKRIDASTPRSPIFRNTDGWPWHPHALNCRFERLRRLWGREAIERLGLLPPKIRRLTKADRGDEAKRDSKGARYMPRRPADVARCSSVARRSRPWPHWPTRWGRRT